MSVTTPTLKFFAAAELVPEALDVAAALDVAPAAQLESAKVYQLDLLC
jgi:hypothetical protein